VSARQVTIAGFVAIGLAGVGLHLLGRREGARVPTLGELVGHLMRTPGGRIGMLVVWWWLGWHFFAR
jgi:Family of unknown function (DUF6186)